MSTPVSDALPKAVKCQSELVSDTCRVTNERMNNVMNNHRVFLGCQGA
jgi:hypothetical protein